MGLSKSRKREIRELLTVLEFEQVWRPVHTDALVRLVKMHAGQRVYKELTSELAKEYREKQVELARAKKELEREAAVEREAIFQAELSKRMPRMAVILRDMQEFAHSKALVDKETGEVDWAGVKPADAKVALEAIGHVVKILGLAAPTKVDVQAGTAFAQEGDW